MFEYLASLTGQNPIGTMRKKRTSSRVCFPLIPWLAESGTKIASANKDRRPIVAALLLLFLSNSFLVGVPSNVRIDGPKSVVAIRRCPMAKHGRANGQQCGTIARSASPLVVVDGRRAMVSHGRRFVHLVCAVRLRRGIRAHHL